jgi:hypothetical protein
MSCKRCGGLMVVEASCDLREDAFCTGVDPMRCLNCGNFEDAIIRANRMAPHVQDHVRSRTGKARGPRIVQMGWLQQAV